MSFIQPALAAELADGVYEVRDLIFLKGFLAKKIFIEDPRRKVMLKAEVGARIVSVKDGFAVCARGGAGYEGDLFLIFRGTTLNNYGADVVSDLRFGVERSKTGLPVHVGFNHAFTSMLTQLRTFLAGNLSGITRIHCVGHSLGGAVATLAADWVKSHTGLRVMLYTFGCPRVGFEFFSETVTTKLSSANIFRVYHETDPVPMVPVYPYSHTPAPGYGYYLPSSQMTVTGRAHKMAEYIASVGGKTWKKIKGPPPLSSSEQAVLKWLASDAPVSPMNPETWAFINAGLQWVLKKIMVGAAAALQMSVMSVFTLADKISWLLLKGIDLAKETGVWVLRVMRKIMQALGMRVVKSVEQLTRAFMRNILERLIRKTTEEAVRALRGMIG